MKPAFLEHVNVTISDPAKTAAMLCDVFDWHIRWQGDSIHGGHTIHVGSKADYIALYTKGDKETPDATSYERVRGLNHIALVVDDLDATENRIVKSGIKTFNHNDYDPGRRFYFYDHDGIEYEVVSYAPGVTGDPS